MHAGRHLALEALFGEAARAERKRRGAGGVSASARRREAEGGRHGGHRDEDSGRASVGCRRRATAESSGYVFHGGLSPWPNGYSVVPEPSAAGMSTGSLPLGFTSPKSTFASALSDTPA